MSVEMETALSKMLTTLEAKVDSSHAALIVVDLQNDFVAEGGVWDKQGRDMGVIQAIVPRLINVIGMAREVSLPIIYIQSIYNSKSNWYLSDVWLEQVKRRIKGPYIEYPVCEENSWGAEFYDGIKPLPDEVVVKKHRFSAFINTDLALILKSKGIRTLIVAGVATHICVETTIRDGFMKDYYVVLLKDCVASFSKELHDNAIKIIDLWFGQVVSSSDVIKCWAKEKR